GCFLPLFRDCDHHGDLVSTAAGGVDRSGPGPGGGGRGRLFPLVETASTTRAGDAPIPGIPGDVSGRRRRPGRGLRQGSGAEVIARHRAYSRGTRRLGEPGPARAAEESIAVRGRGPETCPGTGAR